jgi:uncharacterized protein YecA (UPF0149 family)
MPEESRDETLREMQSSLEMDDKEFDDFRSSIILPMLQRHEEMFPRMHARRSFDVSRSGHSESIASVSAGPRRGSRGEAYPGTDRYAPCPCGSDKKYKFCCGKKGL